MKKSVLNAFSVDVEDYFQVSAFESTIDRSDWTAWPSRVERNTNEILEILDNHGVTATFFVLGWVAEKFPELVRSIDRAGHEVGCHGYSHSRITIQSREVFVQETERAKTVLEQTVGARVRGYRAASFSITKETLWALDALAEFGFDYDSSIYPIWHDSYGIPGASLSPFVYRTSHGKEIIEFPLCATSVMGVRVPAGGGGYFRLYPFWMTRMLLDQVVEERRPINFYCHPWEIDVEQPRVEGIPLKSRFRHYNNIPKFKDRLNKLFNRYQFGSCSQVLENFDTLIDDSRSGAGSIG